MKKAFSAFLAAALAVSAVPAFSVSAAEFVPENYILTITPDKTSAVAGDVITYTVSVEVKGDDRFSALCINFDIPDGLEFVIENPPMTEDDLLDYDGDWGITKLPGYDTLRMDYDPSNGVNPTEPKVIGLTEVIGSTTSGVKTPLAKVDILSFKCKVKEGASGDQKIGLAKGTEFSNGSSEGGLPTYNEGASAVDVAGGDVAATDITADGTMSLGKHDEKKNVNAKLQPDGATDTITYSSDTPAVATVDKDGNVTAVADGVAKIISKAAKLGKEATTTVTVKIVHELEAVAAVPATCTAEGTEAYYKCKVCGNLYSDAEGKNLISNPVTIPKTAHTIVSVAAKDPTCTEAGTAAAYQCSVCKKYFSDAAGTTEITAPTTEAALGHDWGEWTVTTPATCGKEGVETRVCKRDPNHTETRAIAKLTTHTPGEPTKENEVAATCGKDGSYDLVTKCTVCGEVLKTEKVTVPATGNHTLKHVDAVPSNCTEEGAKEYWQCEVCGKMFSDAEGKNEITGAEKVAALGHTPGDVVKENEVAATCGKDGSYDEVIYCTVCNEEIDRKTILLKATGDHTLEDVEAKAATCTEDGNLAYKKCSVCGKIFEPDGTTETTLEAVTLKATGHDWGEWEVVTEATETTDGLRKRVCKTDATHVEEEKIPATGTTVVDDSSSSEVVDESSSDASSDTSSKDTSSKASDSSKAAANGSTTNPGTGAAAGTVAAGIAVLAALAVVKKKK